MCFMSIHTVSQRYYRRFYNTKKENGLGHTIQITGS